MKSPHASKHRPLQLCSAEMSETNPSDNCRLCKVSFKVKFGNLGKQSHSSSENLFKPSKRQDCFGVRLYEICSQVGLPFVQDSLRFSDRVCNPCGRKIRNLGQLYEFVKAANTSLTGTPIHRSKRTLATPEKASPSWRKSKSVRVNSPAAKKPAREASPAKSRKSLAFSGENSALSTSLQRHDEMLSRLNVDNLPNDGVKIVYLNPSGNVTVRSPLDSQTKTLIKNIAAEKWREVSNAILKHEDIVPELKNGINKVISREFNEYLKSGSMLEARNPDELAGFSNKLFLEEVRIYCPVWFHCTLGASGLSQEDLTENGPDVNSLALATATIARVRNSKASAVHYRISTIMFHSGVKHADLIRLNRLGICMSPDATVTMQKKMTEQLEGKVQIWKASIEENRGALLLAREVIRKQIAARQLDVTERSLESYEHYSAAGYKALKALLDKECNTAEGDVRNMYTADCIQTVVGILEGTKLPLFK